jgi:hypothetical protein
MDYSLLGSIRHTASAVSDCATIHLLVACCIRFEKNKSHRTRRTKTRHKPSDVVTAWSAKMSFDLATTDWKDAVDQTSTAAVLAVNGTSMSPPLSVSSSSSRVVTQVLLSVIGSVGTVANGYVLLTIILCKELRKNITNVFICNQTIIDCLACIALAITMLLQKMAVSSSAIGFSKQFLCWLFDNTGFLGSSVYASKFSLVIITLERYFKVVHPVKHRNKLRPWMIKLGIIAPWADGLFVGLLPQALFADVVNGRCLTTITTSVPGKTYSVFMFVMHFLIPLVTFVFCYWKILAVILHQNRLVHDSGLSQPVVSSISGNLQPPSTPDAVSEKAAGCASKHVNKIVGGGDQYLSKTEKKAIRTMLIVTACFIVCWFPVDLYQDVFLFFPQLKISSAGMQSMTMLAYLNILLDAVIYSAHLNVVGRTWHAVRKLSCRKVSTNIGTSSSEQQGNSSGHERLKLTKF